MKAVLRFSNRFFLLVLLLLVSNLQAQDTIPPVILLNPGSTGSIELSCDNAPYIDPGAVAYDNRDGNLTNAIIVYNNVNTKRQGKYMVRYTVTDVSGNKTSVVRTVIVESTKYPAHFDVYNNGTSYLFTTYQYSQVSWKHNWMINGDTIKEFKNEIALNRKLTNNQSYEVCILNNFCGYDTTYKYCQLVSDTIPDSRWITYQSFRDLNGNCLKDIAEEGLGLTVKLENTNGKNIPVIVFDQSMAYSIIDSNTRYYLRLYPLQYDSVSLSCLAHDTIIAPQNYQDTMLHLTVAYGCKPRLSDYEVWGTNASGRVFPGQTFQIYSSAGNRNFYSYNNCNRPDSGWLVYTLYGKGEFKSMLGSSLTPDTFTSKKIVIKVDNLNLMNKAKYAAFNVFTDTSAKAGDTISIGVKIICPAAESSKLNNNNFRRFVVTNSYDPNMKSVSHEKVSPGFEDWLTYKIDFQNTGNAEAINIVLRDTLDPGLDLNSYSFIDASHTIQSYRTGNVLRFEFDNINLPDSGTDQAGSHGFVIYKVKPLSPMLLNQTIRNTAYIYFDFNDPVVTNTAETYTYVSDASINSAAFAAAKIWPNPVHDVLNIQSLNEGVISLSLMDACGKLVKAFTVNQTGKLDLKGLSSGLYILRLESANSVQTIRIFKD